MKKVYLCIEYKNGIEKIFYFDSWKEAYDYVVQEGDHVEDYWIE